MGYFGKSVHSESNSQSIVFNVWWKRRRDYFRCWNSSKIRTRTTKLNWRIRELQKGKKKKEKRFLARFFFLFSTPVEINTKKAFARKFTQKETIPKTYFFLKIEKSKKNLFYRFVQRTEEYFSINMAIRLSSYWQYFQIAIKQRWFSHIDFSLYKDETRQHLKL